MTKSPALRTITRRREAQMVVQKLKRAGIPAMLMLAGMVFAPEVRAQDPLDAAFNEQASADRAAIQLQAQIDQAADRTADKAAKYRNAIVQADNLKAYNKQLSAQVASQGKVVEGKRQALADIETTKQKVEPLMQKMIDALASFVELDVPFLLAERQDRIAKLQAIMADANVSSSERYRRILEAYQIELEYGRTLDSYNGTVAVDGQEKQVDFVRLGRIALMYQTPDGSETAYWDNTTKKWVLDDSYGSDVTAALKVAKKQGAPDLLLVPVPAPKEISK